MKKETYNIIRSFKEEYESSKNVLTHLIKKLVLTSFNDNNSFEVKVEFDKPVSICVPSLKSVHYSVDIINVAALKVRYAVGDEDKSNLSPTDYEVVECSWANIYGTSGEFIATVEQLPTEAIYAILLELELECKLKGK